MLLPILAALHPFYWPNRESELGTPPNPVFL